jgi:hypothetical protein
MVGAVALLSMSMALQRGGLRLSSVHQRGARKHRHGRLHQNVSGSGGFSLLADSMTLPRHGAWSAAPETGYCRSTELCAPAAQNAEDPAVQTGSCRDRHRKENSKSLQVLGFFGFVSPGVGCKTTCDLLELIRAQSSTPAAASTAPATATDEYSVLLPRRAACARGRVGTEVAGGCRTPRAVAACGVGATVAQGRNAGNSWLNARGRGSQAVRRSMRLTLQPPGKARRRSDPRRQGLHPDAGRRFMVALRAGGSCLQVHRRLSRSVPSSAPSGARGASDCTVMP